MLVYPVRGCRNRRQYRQPGYLDQALRRRFGLTLSILVGTAVGLLVKYVLDKKYIFEYRVANLADDTRTSLRYTSMGVVTTLIFWGFEYGFEHLFATKSMRYLGGVIGLCIG